MEATLQSIRNRHAALSPHLSELQLRLWAASEAEDLDWGGITRVHDATGIAESTIRRGLEELHQPPRSDDRQRNADDLCHPSLTHRAS